jgi:ATP-binding cassette subfamily F protein uup
VAWVDNSGFSCHRVREEEVWIRQGIKARRTRNEGRVRALKALREESKARRSQQGKVSMATQDASRSGKVVFEIEHLSVKFGDNAPIINDFSALVMRGDRIGLVGDNGVGKTTLIKAILGQLKHGGTVKTGTQLEVAYFDQLRNVLDLEKSVKDNVAEGSDHVDINGSRRHIYSYLQDFLFSPERARTPVKALSGGERNRILLAKLLLKPSNLIVMDEPTNDLDMVTLELLEEMLSGYKGTLLLISHDRAFMDNVVTSTWVFDGKGNIDEYIGGYQDYLEQRPNQTAVDQKSAVKKAAAKAEAAAAAPAPKKVKLSYKDQRELEQLPAEIEALESEQAELSDKLADGSWFVKDAAAATKASERLGEIDEILLEKMERWDELENMTKG